MSGLGTGDAIPAAEAADKELEKVTVSADADSPYTVRESRFSHQTRPSLRETPQSETIITREMLGDENPTTLGQVLDSTPGVYSYSYDSERVLFTARRDS